MHLRIMEDFSCTEQLRVFHHKKKISTTRQWKVSIRIIYAKKKNAQLTLATSSKIVLCAENTQLENYSVKL